MISPFSHVERRSHPWRAPISVAAGLRDQDGALALISDGGPLGRFSYVAAQPDQVSVGPFKNLDRLRRPGFQTGVVALLAYDAGARPATGPRPDTWPDLMLARYPAMLVFDHQDQAVLALGRGGDQAAAAAAADLALGWLAQVVDPPSPPAPAERLDAEAPADRYLAAVADVVARIARGDLFQANIARAWAGELRPGADPFDVLVRLASRAAAFGAYWRLGDRAIVSNSPELFLTFDPGTRRVETRPIKGTRPRDPDPARDADLADELAVSAKDRAENLMIVDLMRNDLSRVSEAGSVSVEKLFVVEQHPTVHHLVSTVAATARQGVTAADLLEATFPPGSITGAPKHQAMKVIAAHEPPRGPWCGTLAHVDEAGRLTASVLIRTASFTRASDRWLVRTQAGAGIVADSNPVAELAETEAKIRALREALVDQEVQVEQAIASTSRGRRK